MLLSILLSPKVISQCQALVSTIGKYNLFIFIKINTFLKFLLITNFGVSSPELFAHVQLSFIIFLHAGARTLFSPKKR
jgi:hypothetical protein